MKIEQVQKQGNKPHPRFFQKRVVANALLGGFCVLALIATSRPSLAGGISSATQRALAYSRSHGGIALLIKQGNSIILENYDHGGSPIQRSPAFSMTKSLCGLMAMAGDADRIFSLDERVSDTIFEWREDPLKARITVRQLLNQTSGLASGYNALYAQWVPDKGRIAIHVARQHPPGAGFLYAPSHWEAFEEFLRRKLKSQRTTPLAYLRRKVLVVCGVDTTGWRTDRSGNPYFSTGAMLTARQLIKAGDFLLNSGRWSFSQLGGCRSKLEALRAGTLANPMYSMGFWLNRASQVPGVEEVAIEQKIGGGYSASSWRNACISKYAPPDLIAMVGSHGQRLYVIPSRWLIVARQGEGNSFRDSEFLRLLFN